MILEVVLGSGTVFTAAGVIYGYGKLAQRVEDIKGDIHRLDERVADLTDFLLREARGEDGTTLDQKRGAAPVVDLSRGNSERR